MTRVKTSLFLAILLFITSFGASAQSPCGSVYGDIIAPSIQYGAYNFFGARVSIAQAHYEDITVTGTIHEEGGNASREFTLTIYQGQTTAETDVYYLQAGPASSAGITIESVSSCPSPSPAAIYSLSNQQIVETYSGLENVLNNSFACTLFTREKVNR